MTEGLTFRHDKTGTRHDWVVVGPGGAVNIWCEEFPEGVPTLFGERWYGGVEVHSRVPSGYREGDPPSHEMCEFLDGPCWHDGSSLWFTRSFMPFLERLGADSTELEQWAYAELLSWYRTHLERRQSTSGHENENSRDLM